MTSWESWLKTITNGSTTRAIAAAIGRPTSNSSVSRWMREQPPADAVIAIAHAYGADPVAGLVAAGLVHDSELSEVRVVSALKRATSLQLIEELMRREIASEIVAEMAEEKQQP